MFRKKSKPDPGKLAHELRKHIHASTLNLEAAQGIAGKIEDKRARQLLKHLKLAEEALEKLQERLIKAVEAWQ